MTNLMGIKPVGITTSKLKTNHRNTREEEKKKEDNIWGISIFNTIVQSSFLNSLSEFVVSKRVKRRSKNANNGLSK